LTRSELIYYETNFKAQLSQRRGNARRIYKITIISAHIIINRIMPNTRVFCLHFFVADSMGVFRFVCRIRWNDIK